MLLFVLSLCGFAGSLAMRLLDPLITSIAAGFGATIAVVALLSSVFTLPMGLSQLVLGPAGDTFGKTLLIKAGMAVLALSLVASALAPDLSTLFLSRVLGGIAVGAIMPVCMALIGDAFPLGTRQVALSRYIAATLVGQLLGASAGGIIGDLAGWRAPMAVAAVVAALAAVVAVISLPRREAGSARNAFRLGDAVARYRLVFANPRSFVCFGVVFLEGLSIYGVMPFIGDLLQRRGEGGLREAGFVIGGLGIGGLLYALVIPAMLKLASRASLMILGGSIAAVGLAGVGLHLPWWAQMALMVVVGFGFFLLHNSVQVEVTELAPSARSSSFSMHAFSFMGGQALGPIVYGLSIPTVGPAASTMVAGAILALTGIGANRLLR